MNLEGLQGGLKEGIINNSILPILITNYFYKICYRNSAVNSLGKKIASFGYPIAEVPFLLEEKVK